MWKCCKVISSYVRAECRNKNARSKALRCFDHRSTFSFVHDVSTECVLAKSATLLSHRVLQPQIFLKGYTNPSQTCMKSTSKWRQTTQGERRPQKLPTWWQNPSPVFQSSSKTVGAEVRKVTAHNLLKVYRKWAKVCKVQQIVCVARHFRKISDRPALYTKTTCCVLSWLGSNSCVEVWRAHPSL